MVNLLKPNPDEGDSSTFEFYTVEETGESGMSQSGLAILCGVTQPAISGLETTLISRAPSRWLEPLLGQDLTLISSQSDPSLTINGRPSGNLRVYRASVCARIIQHYAFQGNQIAQYSLDQFTELGINQWIQGITGWERPPERTYIPYWYQRLTLFTSRTRIPDGWWSVFEELAKMMRELEGYGYVLPDVSETTGQKITPDISIGQLFCKHMRAKGFDVHGTVRKYKHYYPDGREPYANIYPDEWLTEFRSWFNSHWKPSRLADYLGSRDPQALPSIAKLLGLPEADD